MSVKSKVMDLCTPKGIKIGTLERETGLSNGTIRKWSEDSTINGKTLVAIADYFGVTTDYILDREQQKPIQMDGLTPDKAEFIALVQQMTPEQVRALIAVAKLTLRDQ